MSEDRLEPLFTALADPTRRTVMARVAGEGPVTASELARQLPVSRQAIARHLTVLREAGLVDSARIGRETRFTLTPEPLDELARWAAKVGRQWDARLQALSDMAAGGPDGDGGP